jgi:hypothetical protein
MITGALEHKRAAIQDQLVLTRFRAIVALTILASGTIVGGWQPSFG